MFVTLFLICGLPQGPMGCQATLNPTPHATQAGCEANLKDALGVFSATLPEGVFVADHKCVAMSVLG